MSDENKRLHQELAKLILANPDLEVTIWSDGDDLVSDNGFAVQQIDSVEIEEIYTPSFDKRYCKKHVEREDYFQYFDETQFYARSLDFDVMVDILETDGEMNEPVRKGNMTEDELREEAVRAVAGLPWKKVILVQTTPY